MKEFLNMTEQNSQAKDISSKLWDMANQLRGNMDAGEYRNYILGFMFYRYLSEHQETYLKSQDLVELTAKQTINEAYRQEAQGDELQDYLLDISQSLGYAMSPEYTWATIVSKVQDSTLAPSDFQAMFDDFETNAKLNPNARHDFQGIFTDVNLSNTRLGTTTAAKAKALSKIVELVNSFDYNDEQGHDILGDVYEYLIAKFAGNSGKKAGEFYTPHEVSMVLAKLVTYQNQSDKHAFTVYDPAMGSGSLLLTVGNEVHGGYQHGKVQFFGQELNTTTYNLARMNLMMHGVDYQNMTLSNADSLEQDWPDGLDQQGIDHPRQFDAIVENPPYSAHWDNQDSKLKDPRFKDYSGLAPKSKADYSFLLHGFYHLNETGTMAIILPHGVLFRGAKEAKIRQALLEKNQIDAIIGMPAGLFYSTGIPTVILVLKKQRVAKDVLFIDASKEFEKGKNQNKLLPSNIDKIIRTYQERKDVDKFAHVASLAEIQENDYNLNIPRYVDTFEPEPEIDLNQVKAELAQLDQEIAQANEKFKEMASQLVETHPDKQGDNK
ncbi:type I restriction-modification system, M subunit [Liquorilactobacillus ghanensis DSM 18630]|uniref:site-specific DNA-methyltransferase (adenine-specific) n=2 Tax=Liquorilactobacillus ghanensis TaxID=399370 RepID=A0A0R1VNW9_9LACO|nr:type I restriction-modification system, M subunit [Liquorilactobacillus ghanensis DSM 18630]